MKQAEVAVSLINWRRPDEIAQTIDRLGCQTHRHLRVYVVNNGDPAQLRAALPERPAVPVSIMETGRNIGFSGACNLSLARALEERLPYLWIMNTDTRLGDGCLAALIEDAARHPEAGLFSPVIRHDNAEQSVWVAGGSFDVDSASFSWFESEAEGIDCARRTPQRLMLPGTALLVRTEALMRIGPMDERLFVYHEDVDLSIRAERAGIKRRLVPDTDFFHNHGPGTRPAPYVGYYTTRNTLLVAKKHFRAGVALRRHYWDFIRLREASASAAVDREALQLCQLGYWHGIRGIGGEMLASATVPRLFQRLFGESP